MRGQRADYDAWAAAGNAGWRWDDVLPYFIRHEDHHSLDQGGADPLHGKGGEWRVEKIRVQWAILDAFRTAARECGIPSVDDFNRGDNFGCGYFEVNQRAGVRWNTSKAFLRPVLNRPNLKIVSGAQVTRILLRGDGSQRVDGVEYRRGGGAAGLHQVKVRGELILAAGSVHSPALLQSSGIGDPAHLQSVGVKPLVAVPGVGRNLQDHLQLRLVYKVSGIPTLNTQANSLWGKAWMGAQYALGRQGPMTMSPSQLGAFARSDPGLAHADLEYHVQPLSLDKFGEPLHRFPAFTASVCHLRPSSRGTVLIDSADPLQAPKIRPNYLSTEDDCQVAVRAIELTRRIVAADALRRYRPVEFLPGPEKVSNEALVAAAREVGTTIFHPVGTCRMGRAAQEGAVVDERLRSHTIPGLRIADASVMPTITSGNTNSPTLMIAERAAEWILEDWRRA